MRASDKLDCRYTPLKTLKQSILKRQNKTDEEVENILRDIIYQNHIDCAVIGDPIALAVQIKRGGIIDVSANQVEVSLGRRLSNRRRKAHVSSSSASHDPVPSFLPLFFFFFVGVWLVQPADSSSPMSGRCHPYLVAVARLSPLLRSHLPLSL
ncbi:hypothetical protein Q3G72_011602 [Acer saccharum]|nr:hypothetical protein Q3G72_011602 [Acer saccharum]